MFGGNLRLARPLAVLDLESTGTDPATDRIVEVAVVKWLPGGEPTTLHRRVNPDVPIPAPASLVHGIGDMDIADAPRFAQVAGELDHFLQGADLAGFGITTFDLPLLAAEFARVGRRFRVAGRRVLDALAIYHQYEPRNLSAAVRYYLGRNHDHAHSALADVWAAARVLDRQVGRYGLPGTPDELHRYLVDVDVARRFRRDAAGRIVFAFGKHAGKPLRDVARSDPGYLRWMREQTFLDDVLDLVDRALAGRLRDGE